VIYEAVLNTPIALFCSHGVTHTDETGGRLRARLWGDRTVIVQFPCGCTMPAVQKEYVDRLEGVYEDWEKEHILYPIISELNERS
jgi:hypothetical protein